ERIALLLAVADDIDAAFALAGNDSGDSISARHGEFRLIHLRAAGARGIKPCQSLRSRQAAGVRR
ncbi:MAG TPA: hypothetical protein VIH38_05405, partial [Steroidobacteraceae bacterium]